MEAIGAAIVMRGRAAKADVRPCHFAPVLPDVSNIAAAALMAARDEIPQ